MSSDAVKNERQRLDAEQRGKYVMSVAARLTGVGPARIRRYEAAGLVSPERTSGGQRLFSDRDIGLVKEVARLENEGVNLKGISVILAMRSGVLRG